MLLGFNIKSRGFIGPIGDDLPSVIAILLGLSLFFSGLSFTLNAYNNKLVAYNVLKGTMEIAHKVNENGLISASSSDLFDSAVNIANSYGLNFCVKTSVSGSTNTSCSSNIQDCKVGWLHFSYFSSFLTGGSIKPGVLEVCAG